MTEANRTMKIGVFLAIIIILLTSGCGSNRVHAESQTLQQQVAGGGMITLPAGTINVDCSSQMVASKTTTIIGQGRGITIINDSCPTGDTFFVDVSQPTTVVMENLTIVHTTSSGTVVHMTGGTQGENAILDRVLRLSSVDLKSAFNCLKRFQDRYTQISKESIG